MFHVTLQTSKNNTCFQIELRDLLSIFKFYNNITNTQIPSALLLFILEYLNKDQPQYFVLFIWNGERVMQICSLLVNIPFQTNFPHHMKNSPCISISIGSPGFISNMYGLEMRIKKT